MTRRPDAIRVLVSTAVSGAVVAAAWLALAPASAAADVVRLNDGTVLEGDVKRAPQGGWTVTSPDGRVRRVTADEVRSIEAGTPARAGDAPAVDANLASLRRSLENADDPAVAIEKYCRFLDAAPAGPVADAAREDLATWVDRRDRGLRRAGDDWLAPDEWTARQVEAIAVASEARQLVKDGRAREAETVLRRALALDPDNPAAWYLRGLIAFAQDRMPEARAAFERVDARVPDHPPTLNNLGVVLSRQRQAPGALGFYERAMQAAPGDREILDNVAEAIAALEENQKSAAVAQRAIRTFTAQDQQLQERLAKQGLHRWGATWVTDAQLEQVRAAEARVKQQLDAMAAEFDAARQALARTDADIEANERSIRQIEATSYARDRDGRLRQTAFPAVYYELQRDTEKLRQDRTAHAARLEELRAAARAAQKDVPVPKYTGVQELIGPEGTPIAVPSEADAPTTTAPATQPA